MSELTEEALVAMIEAAQSQIREHADSDADDEVASNLHFVAGFIRGVFLADRFHAVSSPGYRRLHDGLMDMLDTGRLTEADIPDDYQWLVNSLAAPEGPS